LSILGTLCNGFGDHWHIVAGTKKIHQNLPALAYRAKPLGISCCDVRNMPTVGPTIVQSVTVGELDAES
jgi:hypothetical protein